MKESSIGKVASVIAAIVVLGVLGVSGVALAVDSVVVGDTKYTCQNQCVVDSNGYVSDSGGGWIFAEPHDPNQPRPDPDD
ncbi:hypothetical protein [Elongatibacter sediminis]|uniref:Secreted protein n=1 Tax=Elongatibacter sediminis TaxID=3119006 RepID=A0AAW9RIG7_9GAMM